MSARKAGSSPWRKGVEAYVRSVRASARSAREPAAEGPCLHVGGERVRWYRLRATHLDRRLPGASNRLATWAGLQDTSPRSALLELHARMEAVGPSAWEDPDLVQVWFRWSDYVVPRSDVAVFTLGAQPRDPDQVAALEQLADALLLALGGRPRTYREIAAAGWSVQGALLRPAACTGRVHIRWDASSMRVVPAERPPVDVEAARLELARRFLHWHGPAGVDHFAKWAGVTRKDARQTWAALEPELVPVALEGRARGLLAADEPALAAARRPDGVRLLPPDDPYLYLDRDLVAPEPAWQSRLDEAAVSRRLRNSLRGRVLVDGAIVGSWGRVQADVTVAAWSRLPGEATERIAAEAEGLAAPLGKPVRLRWL